MSFRSVPFDSLQLNPFAKLGQDWALVTAGDQNGFNTMTVSWGALGFIWGRPTVTIYIRPQRYTKEFLDSGDTFTLSFYPADLRPVLGYLGKASGRSENKVEKSGLTPFFIGGAACFAEAELIFVCRKMSRTPLSPDGFLNPEIDGRWYPEKDYHDMYIAEITDVLVKD
ncbi:MAG: flavin reductase family protein [Hominenteromicrobium sp.]